MTTAYRIRLTPEVTADVTGDYYPGWHGSREDPPEPESVTIRAVVISGVDVIDEMEDLQLEAIEAAWLQAFHDERDAKDEEPRYFGAQAPTTWKR